MGRSQQIRPREPAPGWHVRRVPSTGSTNDDLVAAAQEGAPHRSVLVAEHQTAGRGRLDRRWEAPPGANLLVSLLFREVPDVVSELTWRVSLAAIDACSEVAGTRPVLKWPNDLLVDDRKLAGVLAQRVGDGSVVVGIGVNVGWAPDGAARLGDTCTPSDLLTALLSCYDALPADVRPRYRAALDTLGRRVLVDVFGSELVGTAADVEADGRLLVVDDAGRTHRLDAGDVTHLRVARPS